MKYIMVSCFQASWDQSVLYGAVCELLCHGESDNICTQFTLAKHPDCTLYDNICVCDCVCMCEDNDGFL
jgi:hypothetical protein